MDFEKISMIIDEKIEKVKIIDVHTHLYPGTFGNYLLRGIDSLLTYHYLIAETLRVLSISPNKFYSLTQKEQADLVWKSIFIERSPVSEACRGVLTVLKELGLDIKKRDLDEFRKYFNSLSVEEHIDLVFSKANIDYIVMTNDPFDSEEMSYWERGLSKDSRFKSAMRLDMLLNSWEKSFSFLREKGYDVNLEVSGNSISELKRFLEETYNIMKPMYLAVSLPPDFKFPENSYRGKIIKDVILPFCKEYNLPFALMIGVKKLINPELKLAGDSVGKADISAIENLCREYPENKFLVTMLSRENQHELCVTARKFKNLMIFGCWWFLNNPSLVKEITRMRIELLGLSFIPQHSDARVLDQLIYKWKHSKKLIGDVLKEKYKDLLETGWLPKEEEIERDIDMLFRKNYEEFLK
jgi:hypothetical protein